MAKDKGQNSISKIYIMFFVILCVSFLTCILDIIGNSIVCAQNAIGDNAQSNSEIRFNFKNIGEVGITYPSNWIVEENISKYNLISISPISQNSSNQIPVAIGFYKQELPFYNNELSFLMELGKNSSSHNDISSTSPFNDTLDKLIYKAEANLTISTLEESIFLRYSMALLDYINKHFNLINVNKTKISNSSALTVDFKYNGKKISAIWTMKNGNIYTIIMTTNNDNSYTKYLPILNKLKDSFIIKDNKSTISKEAVQKNSTNYNP